MGRPSLRVLPSEGSWASIRLDVKPEIWYHIIKCGYQCLGRSIVAEGTCVYADESATGAARQIVVGEALAADLAAFYGALADPTRVRIVSALRRGELCVGDLVLLLEKSQPAVSHQLRILRSLRLVRAHRRGRRVFYTLDDDHVRVLFEQGLEHLAGEQGR